MLNNYQFAYKLIIEFATWNLKLLVPRTFKLQFLCKSNDLLSSWLTIYIYITQSILWRFHESSRLSIIVWCLLTSMERRKWYRNIRLVITIIRCKSCWKCLSINKDEAAWKKSIHGETMILTATFDMAIFTSKICWKINRKYAQKLSSNSWQRDWMTY